MQSIENKTSAGICGNQRGWAFSKIDFLDLGSDADIRKALSEMVAKGTFAGFTHSKFRHLKLAGISKNK